MNAEARDRLRGLNALITGVDGFIGRALSRYLLDSGAAVAASDLTPRPSGLPSKAAYVQCNILDFDQLLKGLASLPTENLVVFHLAGQSNVGKSRIDPLSTWSVNVSGTAHLLEGCRRIGIRRVVFPSTALVYARPAHLPLLETDPGLVDSVYASTKLAAEALIKSYSVDFGFTCRIARLGNVYGPGAAEDSVVNIVLQQVLGSGPVTLRTVASKRDFVYVEDVASGLAALATKMEAPDCEIFNLSSGVSTSIRELVETACAIEGVPPEIIETAPMPPGGTDEIWVSTQRIAEYTGWRPTWTLEAGLRETLAEMKRVKA